MEQTSVNILAVIMIFFKKKTVRVDTASNCFRQLASKYLFFAIVFFCMFEHSQIYLCRHALVNGILIRDGQHVWLWSYKITPLTDSSSHLFLHIQSAKDKITQQLFSASISGLKQCLIVHIHAWICLCALLHTYTNNNIHSIS